MDPPSDDDDISEVDGPTTTQPTTVKKKNIGAVCVMFLKKVALLQRPSYTVDVNSSIYGGNAADAGDYVSSTHVLIGCGFLMRLSPGRRV